MSALYTALLEGETKESLAAMVCDLREQVREEWMPIETAPKDGTEVLVSDGFYIAVAHHNEGYRWESVSAASHLIPPTRWRLLPKPPSHQEREG